MKEGLWSAADTNRQLYFAMETTAGKTMIPLLSLPKNPLTFNPSSKKKVQRQVMFTMRILPLPNLTTMRSSGRK
jgi:hypothetical protein